MNDPQIHTSVKERSLRPVVLFIALAVACAVAVGLLLAVFIYRTTATGYYLQLVRERQTITTAAVLRYGVVESAHPEFNAIVVKLGNNFFPDAPARVVTVQILPLTRISRQEMQQQNGVYYSLGPLTPATIADLTPGSRVALLLDAPDDTTQSIVARVIVTGDPL